VAELEALGDDGSDLGWKFGRCQWMALDLVRADNCVKLKRYVHHTMVWQLILRLVTVELTLGPPHQII